MIGLSEIIKMDFGAILVTSIALFLFGIAYNTLIDWLHKNGFNDGKTWLEVVVGVAVVIFATSYTLGVGAALILLSHFAAAGLAMAIGDIRRHAKAQAREVKDRAEK